MEEMVFLTIVIPSMIQLLQFPSSSTLCLYVLPLHLTRPKDSYTVRSTLTRA